MQETVVRTSNIALDVSYLHCVATLHRKQEDTRTSTLLVINYVSHGTLNCVFWPQELHRIIVTRWNF